MAALVVLVLPPVQQRLAALLVQVVVAVAAALATALGREREALAVLIARAAAVVAIRAVLPTVPAAAVRKGSSAFLIQTEPRP